MGGLRIELLFAAATIFLRTYGRVPKMTIYHNRSDPAEGPLIGGGGINRSYYKFPPIDFSYQCVIPKEIFWWEKDIFCAGTPHSMVVVA
jgi:hypothetical protein